MGLILVHLIEVKRYLASDPLTFGDDALGGGRALASQLRQLVLQSLKNSRGGVANLMSDTRSVGRLNATLWKSYRPSHAAFSLKLT
jgi:hypothetical protein